MEGGRTHELTLADVVGIERVGGTILGTTNRGNPFDYSGNGEDDADDYSGVCLDSFERLHLDAMVVIGGDGTLAIADKFHQLGMALVGVPKTIDNDIVGTNSTFGFDTAVSFATEAVDRHAVRRQGVRIDTTSCLRGHGGEPTAQSGRGALGGRRRKDEVCSAGPRPRHDRPLARGVFWRLIRLPLLE